MDNDFKDVLPEGLASYSDHINDDEHYQNDFKVISTYVYFRLRYGLKFVKINILMVWEEVLASVLICICVAEIFKNSV